MVLTVGELSVVLVAALAGGLLAQLVRLPPLVGFLVAGFALAGAGVEEPAQLQLLADGGVALLLFGIGLKLDLRTLIRREVAVTATVHLLVLSGVSAMLVLGLLAAMGGLGIAAPDGNDGWATVFTLGFALSLSSTVFVVKLLDERGGGQALSGRTAIGILVVQDLAAVAFLVLAHGEPPSPWAALLVLLVPAAFLVRPVLTRLGHAELRPLFGLAAALVPGYALFDAVGLKGELGSLVVGMLLAVHPGAADLSRSVLALKDLLLVAFFLSIGFVGLPGLEHLLLAALLLLILPLKALGFAVLFWLAGFRRRTSVRGATLLANFSEFGLIVAVGVPSVLGEEWLVVLATAVAVSFVLSALTSRRPDVFVDAARAVLPDREGERLHPEDRPIDVADAQAVVLGMGRVGLAAYHRLTEEFGLTVLGVESKGDRVEHLRRSGTRVVEGDATDPEFWSRIRSGHVDLAVLAMPFHSSNVDALVQLHAHDFAGTVAVVAQYDQELDHAQRLGASTGVQLYDGAGAELADRGAAEAGFEPRSADD
ncbi:MAG TPA: cation:proton antiporter family protein [Nocardioidaceae bacterium]|nr:cation:proton antiporter family protein [Nocardioidaceae bacterium]